MVIKRKGVGLVVGLFVLLLALNSWSAFSFSVSNSITGNSIKESISNFYETSSATHRAILLLQVFLFIIILIASFFVFRSFKHKKKISKKDFFPEETNKRARTDLDILYEMLKKKDKVGLDEIELAFGVSYEVAMGWAKILENGDLAEVDYPRFGKPILKCVRENVASRNLLKENMKNEKKVKVKVKKSPKKSTDKNNFSKKIKNAKKSAAKTKRVTKK